MCTLSWRAGADGSGYALWFNRDEVNTRAAEHAPRLWPADGQGAGFLAPVDGARGGTWLAVNERGLTVALLNDYGVAWRPAQPSRSRGDVVVETARKEGITAVAAVLSAEALRNTAAFSLVALEADGARACWHWDGVRLEARTGGQVPDFFSSSSYRTAEVIAARRAGFDREAGNGADDEARRAYHFSHDNTRGAESVLMCRPDANTRSVCLVRVGAAGAVLEYVPVTRGGAGPETGEMRRWILPRAGA
jgi:hypothetical protein